MPKTHIMRPGAIRGTQILCEDAEGAKQGDYVAEMSERGMVQVDCPDCKFVAKELMFMLHWLELSGV